MLAWLTVGTAACACAWALRRIAHRPGGGLQRRDRSWAITAAWGVLVSSQLLLVLLTIATVLSHTTCAGSLGTVTALVIHPLGVLALFTRASCLFTVVVRLGRLDDDGIRRPCRHHRPGAAVRADPCPARRPDRHRPTGRG
jgi:hypothetical protein